MFNREEKDKLSCKVSPSSAVSSLPGFQELRARALCVGGGQVAKAAGPCVLLKVQR